MAPPPPVENRLEAVNRVRAHQRAWIAETRQRAANGEPFAICNGDEAEELFLAMGIPVLAINYWNFLIAAQGKEQHFNHVLNEHGYAGHHFYGFSLASTLDPTNAPWGGLPRPTVLCGSIRSEMELRVCELWARALDCPCFPLDFAFPSPPLQPTPERWWEYTRERWAELVDPHRLEHRMRQERDLVSYVEQLTGRTFSKADLTRALTLINEQMGHWTRAQALIATAARCPVHIRDQISMYQAMWHRGTPTGVSLLQDYVDEIEERVANGVSAYPNERFRLYYGVQVPPWHQAIEEKYGAVAVCCSYTNVPDLYRREIFDDPFKALAARHMFLFGFGPARVIDVAKRHRCDAVIVIEADADGPPSPQARAVEAAGLPYLALPRAADDEDNRARIGAFIEERLM